MHTWKNKVNRELTGHREHFGTQIAAISVTVYPIIFPDKFRARSASHRRTFIFYPLSILFLFLYLQGK